MSTSILVYESSWGVDVIPQEIVLAAEGINNGKSVLDKRTRGYRNIIKPWEVEQEKKVSAAFKAARV